MARSRRENGRRSGLLRRYRDLPRTLRSRRPAVRRRAQRLLALTICVPIMLVCALYMISWEATRLRIERGNAAYSALYPANAPASEAAPPQTTTTGATVAPEAAPTVTVSVAASEPAPTTANRAAETSSRMSISTPRAEQSTSVSSTPEISATETAFDPASAAPTLIKTPEPATPTSTPATPAPTAAVALDATRVPLATPDAQTRVYALETAPPVQSSFADLLALNPDTVGFLRIGDAISLPVVQRENDNEFYLTHSFSLEESIGGTLFLDGANLLVPEDANLIVYGHNMRNGTMFHALLGYDQLSFLKENALVRFDTIYQNRSYAPFAVLTVTAEPGSERYFNIRQFGLDDAGFEDYVAALRALSVWDIPVDVAPGDRLLLLVTCEYTHNDGRFVVALRALRPDEDADDVRALVQSATAK